VEAAAYLGVSTATIRRWAREGQLRLRSVDGNGRATVCHHTELQRLTRTLNGKPKRKRKRHETPEEKARRESFERLAEFRKQLEARGCAANLYEIALEEHRALNDRGWIE
jgi:DNA-binding transcriptional MerR regulator